ncbi:MAG: SIMPL domain-containing protein [Alphaproteobacteria bacterium]|nr:SIMPL domain-containing protein [Alphaproteobacteria bacterium]
MFRTLFAAAALASAPLALSPAVFAQESAPTPATLSLSATGEVSLVPDQATVSAGVVTQGDSAAEAVRANALAMSRVFAELRRAGVAERDLQTSQLSVNPIYQSYDRSSSREPRITGYEARNTVSAMVRDIDEVGDVIDAVFEAGANTLNGVSFSSSEAEEAQDEARRRAVAELMALRDLYADAAGFQVVRLMSFSESGGGRPYPVMARTEAFSSDASTPVAAGELTISATVSAVWEIEG